MRLTRRGRGATEHSCDPPGFSDYFWMGSRNERVLAASHKPMATGVQGLGPRCLTANLRFPGGHCVIASGEVGNMLPSALIYYDY